MRKFVLTPPLLAFVVGTRAAAAFGIGLIVGERIPTQRRRALGYALLAIGAATTIPAAIAVFRSGDGSRFPSAALSEVMRTVRKAV